MSHYLGSWGDLEDVERDYQVDLKDELAGGEMLIAWYGSGDYSGGSFVFYRKFDGTYWVDECHHCSCNGVEGGWSPCEVQPEELLEQAGDESWNSQYDADDDLRAALSEVLEDILCPDPRSREVLRILKNAEVQRAVNKSTTPEQRAGILQHAKDLLAEQYPDVTVRWVDTISGSSFLTVRPAVH